MKLAAVAKADKPDTDYQPRARYASEEFIGPIDVDANGMEVDCNDNEPRKCKRVVITDESDGDTPQVSSNDYFWLETSDICLVQEEEVIGNQCYRGSQL